MRQKLIRWEIENGYKGKFVAEKLGIANSTWSNIKNGRQNPTYELLEKFKKEFKPKDVITLFAEDES